jgi:sugar-specific transcriptional regulator TrmB
MSKPLTEEEKKRLRELKKKNDEAERKSAEKSAERKQERVNKKIADAVDKYVDERCVTMKRGGKVMEMRPTIAGGTHAFVYHDGIPVNVYTPF